MNIITIFIINYNFLLVVIPPSPGHHCGIKLDKTTRSLFEQKKS